MKMKESITDLIYTAYESMGHDPKDITNIVPENMGSWKEALSYRVTRQDDFIARVWRKDIDDNNVENIKVSLALFQQV